MVLIWQPIEVDTDPDDPLPVTADPAGMVDTVAELLAALERPAWHRDASCRGQGPARWFPGRGEPTEPARNVCAACPVATECLEAGMAERHGLWGGESERTRRQLRRTAA